jgi:hypothetical protein
VSSHHTIPTCHFSSPGWSTWAKHPRQSSDLDSVSVHAERYRESLESLALAQVLPSLDMAHVVDVVVQATAGSLYVMQTKTSDLPGVTLLYGNDEAVVPIAHWVGSRRAQPNWMVARDIDVGTRSTEQQASRWGNYVARRLNEMRNAPSRRDVYPDENILRRAWRVATTTFEDDTMTPSVVPSSQGGLVFVWHKHGWDAELEIELGEVSVFAYNRRTRETWHGALDDLREQFLELLRGLSAG